MTRERLADGLETLVLQLANGDTTLPEGWEPHEWASPEGHRLPRNLDAARAVLDGGAIVMGRPWWYYPVLVGGSFVLGILIGRSR